MFSSATPALLLNIFFSYSNAALQKLNELNLFELGF